MPYVNIEKCEDGDYSFKIPKEWVEAYCQSKRLFVIQNGSILLIPTEMVELSKDAAKWKENFNILDALKLESEQGSH